MKLCNFCVGGEMDEKTDNGGAKKIMSPCDVEALKKCLRENKGDSVKCQAQVEAFRSSFSLKKPHLPPRPSLKLPCGSMTDL